MKPRMTDCPRTTFVEAGVELRLSGSLRREHATNYARSAESSGGFGHRFPSSRHSAALIDTSIRSQKYIQNP